MRTKDDIMNRIPYAMPLGGSTYITELKIGSLKGSVVFSFNEGGWEHVSFSPYNHNKLPSWDDMCDLKDIFFEDEEAAIQIHPKKSEYVNIMNNCLHLWRHKDIPLPE